MEINVKTFSEEQTLNCLYRGFASGKDARPSRLLEPTHWGRQWPSPESHVAWAKRKISLADDKTVLVEAPLCLRDLLITLRTRLPLRLPDTNKKSAG